MKHYSIVSNIILKSSLILKSIFRAYLSIYPVGQNKTSIFLIYNLVEVVVWTADDQVARDDMNSLVLSNPLRVNVSVSEYSLQVQTQPTLERVHQGCECNFFWQIVS